MTGSREGLGGWRLGDFSGGMLAWIVAAWVGPLNDSEAVGLTNPSLIALVQPWAQTAHSSNSCCKIHTITGLPVAVSHVILPCHSISISIFISSKFHIAIPDESRPSDLARWVTW